MGRRLPAGPYLAGRMPAAHIFFIGETGALVRDFQATGGNPYIVSPWSASLVWLECNSGLQLNGGFLTGATGGSGVAIVGDLIIGRFSNPSASYLGEYANADVAEIIIYNRARVATCLAV